MKIQKLILESHVPAALAAFYGDLLQLPVKKESDQVIVQVGNSQLVFKPAKENTRPYYHFAFNIPSNKIEEAGQWLSERTTLLWLDDYHSSIADFDTWHARAIYFYDPAGNVVELIARFDLNDNEIEQFSPAQIRNISEACVVFSHDQFDANTSELMQQYELTYFGKQEPLPQFRTIGDDEGLLICVPEKRPWYPTKDKTANINPMTVFADTGMHQIELNL